MMTIRSEPTVASIPIKDSALVTRFPTSESATCPADRIARKVDGFLQQGQQGGQTNTFDDTRHNQREKHHQALSRVGSGKFDYQLHREESTSLLNLIEDSYRLIIIKCVHINIFHCLL